VPAPITRLYNDKTRNLYHVFVPKNKVEVYFNPELQIKTLDDVAEEVLFGIFLNKKEEKEQYNQMRDECGDGSDAWHGDCLVAALSGQRTKWNIDLGSSIMKHMMDAQDVSRFRLNQKLVSHDLPELEAPHTPPRYHFGRLASHFPVKEDIESYEQAEAISAPLSEALGAGHVVIAFDPPAKWHVSINFLMAELFGLRQYALHEDHLPGGRAFDHSAVSLARLNSARASITRACGRLRTRNLVVRAWEREILQGAALAITVDGHRLNNGRMSADSEVTA
jgi:hypothetical protein